MPKITLYELDEMQLEAIIKKAVGEALQAQQQPAEDKLLTVKECAAFFKVSVSTIYNWENEKLLTKHVLGCKVYYKQSEIEQAAQVLRKWKKP